MIDAAISSFHSDPRVGEWTLMSSPTPLLAILAAYWLLVTKVLPVYMRDRPPLSITGALLTYNSCQVTACTWLVHQTVQVIRRSNMNVLTCVTTDYSDDPVAIRMAELCWWYLMLKLVDLVETVFFVLRKKNNQVSALHLYHHISTPMYSWMMVKFVAGGSPTVYVVLNSAVHVLMYLYYLFTGVGFSKPLAPWKRYLTMLQMIQFGAILLHASQAFFVECPFPKLLPALFIVNVAIVYYMFSGFYEKAYCKTSTSEDSGKLKSM